MTPEQERAASAFVNAAEASDAAVGVPGGGAETSAGRVAPSRPGHGGPEKTGLPTTGGTRRWPWEAAHVRDDVVKGYALRLPEPLYLKLKWVAERTGRSMNTVCREAVEAEIETVLQEEGV